MGRRNTATRHPIPSLKDGDLLYGRPPSLWGIVPTKTGIDKAREILRQKGALKACKEYHAQSTGSTGIACWPYFNLNHEDGRVKFVEFRPSIPITIAEVIEVHGAPEGVLSVFTDFEDGNVYTILLVYYERIWTSVTLAEQVPRTYTVTPATAVARITYNKPYASVVNSPLRVAWRGYGDYPATDATRD